MSYAGSGALQAAIWEVLRADPDLGALVGDAVYDAMPSRPPSGVHVAIGAEDAVDAGDFSAAGARHDFVVSVLDGSESGGFADVKRAAAAVAAALEGVLPALEQGRVVAIWFLRSRARRGGRGGERRVDLTFRARIDFG